MRGILFDFEQGDVRVVDGALALGETEGQVVQTVLSAFRGEFKENPTIGGEIRKQLGGPVDVMWQGKMKRMLKGCGVSVGRISIENDVITIEK